MSPEAEVPRINWERGQTSVGPQREGNVDAPFDNWTSPTGNGGVAPEPKTFFVTAADEGALNKVSITAGAINSIPNVGGTISVTDGMSIYLNATWDVDGLNVVDVVIGTGTIPIPVNTLTESYTLLARVAIVDDATVVTNYAWNYSQAQVCGSSGGALHVHFW